MLHNHIDRSQNNVKLSFSRKINFKKLSVVPKSEELAVGVRSQTVLTSSQQR